MSNNLEFILKLQDLLSPQMLQAAGASEKSANAIIRDLNRVEHQADGAGGGVNRLKGAFGGLLSIAGPLVAAFASFSFLSDSVKDYNDQAQATAQMNATLASTKNAAGISTEALAAQAEALQKTTVYGDEATEKMQSLLLTFTKIKGPNFTEAVPLIEDMATKLGGDLQGAALQVGKALNDPIKGINALSRAGVSFTEGQKETIKHLTETGHVAEAQRMILAELRTEFGGSAAAAAAAGTGPFAILQNRMGEVKESVGELIVKIGLGLMPLFNGIVWVFEKVIGGLSSLISWFNQHNEVMGLVIGVVAWAIATWATYTIVTNAAAWATKAWAVIQAIFNGTLLANPIFWVIGAIIALIAIIGYVIYTTDGWGKQWDSIIKFFKYSWETFKDYFLLKWLEIKDGFMTGLEFIEKGWYHLKSLWDEEGAAAGLAAINNQQTERAAEIANARGVMESDFKTASEALKWELHGNGKTLGTMVADIKGKLGIGGAATTNPLATAAAKNDGLGTGGDIGGGKSKADSINGGGQRNITINIGKQVEKLEVHVANMKEGAQEIESIVREALRRTLYSTNGVTS